jgi:CheY-like chemotaxis protein
VENSDASSKLVLVVDDDENVRSFIVSVLELDGYQVQTASNGAEALELARQKSPDLIITDLMMPDSGGYDVLRGMQMGDGRKIPIIVSTARKMDISTEDMIRAEGNVVGLIHKPVSVTQLQALLYSVLKVQPKKR